MSDLETEVRKSTENGGACKKSEANTKSLMKNKENIHKRRESIMTNRENFKKIDLKS